MRTTVTLDPDVERMLRDAVHRSRSSFKEVVNSAIRRGLARGSAAPQRAPFVVKAQRLGLRAGLDPGGLNRLADDLEVEAFVEGRTKKGRR